ncbi:MAG: sensor histidine kinase [Solirubrobacteraceae bacterium]
MTESRRPPRPPRRGVRPRLRLRSARARILLAIVVLLVGSTALSTVILRQVLIARSVDRIDASLVQEAGELRRLVAQGRNPTDGRRFGRDVEAMLDVYLSRNVPDRDERWLTYVDGRPYRATGPRGDAERLDRSLRFLSRITTTRHGEATVDGRDVSYQAVPIRYEDRTLAVFVAAVDLEAEQAEVDRATGITALVSLVVLALAIAVAYLLTGRILAPLRELTATARTITETDLRRRITVRGDDEIAVLATTFNQMLDRLESAFGSQRAFVSDAGHELRTPITIVRGHLELLGDDPDERRETMALVEDELERMSRIVEDLLLLAKAEQGDILRPGPIDLDLFVEELHAKAVALGDRDWRMVAAPPVTITGDRQRLNQAMLNLVANAAQHTRTGDTIEIGGRVQDDDVQLWVRDEGPGIAPEHRERIFERFARLDAGRRTSGAGLGLSIVRVIVDAHDGRVALRSRVGEGSTFTLHLPADPAPPVGDDDPTLVLGPRPDPYDEPTKEHPR